jgi:RNA polymerase sigma-70 factor (ECF subfamily)
VELPSDGEVVRRVLGGDAASFELIMRRYNQRLFRVARSIVGNDAEAEDIVQEAYLRAFAQLRQFQGRSKFSTWLTKIAVYAAAARRRKLRRLRLVGVHDDEVSTTDSTPIRRAATDDASQRELRHVLADAMEALPPQLRTVFMLRVVERLSTKQTAECLGISPTNVKVRLHRARELLRSSIDRRIGAEARRLYQCAGERCDRIVKNVAEALARIPLGQSDGSAS